MLYRHGVNTRTCPHCAPERRDAVAGLQDQESQAALGQVRGGGQTDRAGADHDDGQNTGFACGQDLLDLNGRGAAAAVTHDCLSRTW